MYQNNQMVIQIPLAATAIMNKSNVLRIALPWLKAGSKPFSASKILWTERPHQSYYVEFELFLYLIVAYLEEAQWITSKSHCVFQQDMHAPALPGKRNYSVQGPMKVYFPQIRVMRENMNSKYNYNDKQLSCH